MTQAQAAIRKIPTESPQSMPGRAANTSGRARKSRAAGRSQVLASGNERAATRGGGDVIELECGITVYPAKSEGGRWRAVWYESDERQQCEAATEEKLAAKLGKVEIRLEANAPNMKNLVQRSSLITSIPTGSPSATGGRASTPHSAPAMRPVRSPDH
jgi:hypothetical protein